MKIFIEKEYFYASSKGTESTDYFRKQLKQRRRRLLPPTGQFQGHPLIALPDSPRTVILYPHQLGLMQWRQTVKHLSHTNRLSIHVLQLYTSFICRGWKQLTVIHPKLHRYSAA